MSATVASFLRKGTGPQVLRSALRRETRAVGVLLQALGTLKSLRAEVPGEVLGADLLGVLSKRMRALLRDEEQSPATADVIPVRGSGGASRSDTVRQSKFLFPVKAEPERGRARQFAAVTSRPRGHGSIPAPPASHDVVSPPTPFTPRREAPRSEPLPVPVIPPLNRKSPSSVGAGVMERGRGRGTARSLLTRKLQEYSELSRPQHTSGRASSQTLGTEEKSGTAVAPQLPWHPAAQAARPWPELTAQQVARKVRALGANASPGRARQTVNSGLPEKVEIQNVFNIEVQAGGSGSAASADDLSEKIADILREQALQHGIDIT